MIFSIAFFNFANSSSKKTFSFNRKFTNSSILNFEKSHEKMNESEYVIYANSDKFIVERDKKIFNTKNDEYKFYFSDINFKNKCKINEVLPTGSNILTSDLEKTLYTNKFKLYQYKTDTKLSEEIILKNFKIISLKALLNSKVEFLAFGELYENKVYSTGFYVIDISTGEIIKSKTIEKNINTIVPINQLRYSGKFNSSYEKTKIYFYCDKYSKIYFFDINGLFTKELSTNENVPLPKITTTKQGASFYTQGATWYTNMGVFFKENKIFVLSAASKIKKSIVIDEYSYKTLKYKQSFKLNYNNMTSGSIRNIFIDNNRIVICFDFYYASFIFSRYI